MAVSNAAMALWTLQSSAILVFTSVMYLRVVQSGTDKDTFEQIEKTEVQLGMGEKLLSLE